MTQRFFTLLLVRHARPRFRKVRLSYPFAISVSIASCTMLAAGFLAPGLYVRMQAQSIALDRLQHENEKLRNEQAYVEGALNQISDRIGAFEARTQSIARELGQSDSTTVQPAGGGALEIGGTAERFPFESDVRYLQARTESLDRTFEQLGDAVQERVRALRATPSGMPVEGRFSHGYGWRKDPWSGDREFHRGIDIVADPGVEIVAPADGVVSRVGRYADYGRSVDINHGYGYVTRYAHMSEVLVKPGESVQRGAAIGKVGSSGRSTGPHLHYEVFRDGDRVNPWDYLEHDRR